MQAADKLRALTANGNDMAFDLFVASSREALGEQFQDVGVVGAGQASVAGDDHVQAVLDGALA